MLTVHSKIIEFQIFQSLVTENWKILRSSKSTGRIPSTGRRQQLITQPILKLGPERPNSRFGQGGHVLLLRRTNPILGGHREDKRNLRRTKGGHFNFKVEKRRTASIFGIIVLV